MADAPPVDPGPWEDIVRRTHLIVAALAAAVFALAPASARAQNEKLDISAFAINMPTALCARSVLSCTGQTSTHRVQPVQSSGATCRL